MTSDNGNHGASGFDKSQETYGKQLWIWIIEYGYEKIEYVCLFIRDATLIRLVK